MRAFKTYIKRLQKMENAEGKMSAAALDELNEIAQVLADNLASRAKKLTEEAGKKTIFPKYVIAAIELENQGWVSSNSAAMAKKALTEYRASFSDEQVKGMRMETRAGLTVSVSTARSYLEGYKTAGLRLAEDAPVALAAIVETILKQLVKESLHAARDNKKATISPRHVFLVVANDGDLASFLARQGYKQRSGGVIPHINASLVKEKKHTKSTRQPQLAGRRLPHRFRAGTVSLRKIRRYQKSDENIIAMTTSRSVLSEAIADSTVNSISKDAHSAFHEFLQSELVSLLINAVRLTVHAGRITTDASDVRLASLLMYVETIPGVLQPSLKTGFLKKPELERASFRAGIKTRSQDFFSAADGVMHALILRIARTAVKSAETLDRKTLKPVDIRTALDTFRIPHGVI